MNLRRLRRYWDALGKSDPFWAILTVPEKKGNRWDLDEFLSTGRGEIDDVLADLRSLGLEPKSGRALDFGCGVGRLTQALADRFDEAWGVDIAPSMIELANRYSRDPERCRYFLNTRPDLRLFEDESFDFVYSNITLQHVEPRYQGPYLAEFLRVLVPGGLLVFQLPSTPSNLDVPIASGEYPAPKRRIRERAKAVTPDPVLRIYGLLRRGWPMRKVAAPMEMWGMPRDQVEALLVRHGGKLLNTEPDEWAAGWEGFRYTVAKGEPPHLP